MIHIPTGMSPEEMYKTLAYGLIAILAFVVAVDILFGWRKIP